MSARGTILVVEDDAEMRQFLLDELEAAGHRGLGCASGSEALALLAEAPVDIVVTDLMMPGMRGSDLLAQVGARDRGIPVVIITAFGSIDSAVESIKAGAYHYVAKPFRSEVLLATIDGALEERGRRRQLEMWRVALREGGRRIVAESPAMRRAIDLVLRAAGVDMPLLLLGESGTGKDLLARLAHDEGPRRTRPFLAVNCAAIPETLLESQLFGYRRGAFTDAREDRRGLFQEADGGTLFLDEIGDLPPPLQGKLLRVLQEREIHPLGSPAPVPVDTRVVAATHRDLAALIEEGRFRQDLYYRLNVIAVHLPPLRERPEDLVPLIAHFLEKHGKRLGRLGAHLSSPALGALLGHAWPGNVRELENAIERALVFGGDDTIGREDLPETLRGSAPHAPRPIVDVEREHILKTLRAVNRNKTAAARALGLDRKTLYRKLKHYGIRVP